eukprot:1826994-Prymnesium_polylepis.2
MQQPCHSLVGRAPRSRVFGLTLRVPFRVDAHSSQQALLTHSIESRRISRMMIEIAIKFHWYSGYDCLYKAVG